MQEIRQCHMTCEHYALCYCDKHNRHIHYENAEEKCADWELGHDYKKDGKWYKERLTYDKTAPE